MPEEQPVPAAQPAQPAQPTPSAKPASDDNLIAAISYVSLIGVIILLTKKDSEYVKFHAKQGTVIFIGEVILGVVASFTWDLSFLWGLIWLVFIIVSAVGFIKAYSGEKYRVPLVADLADKINI